MQFTEEQITAAARKLCDLSSEACGIHPEDNWKEYGDAYKIDARLALEAAGASQPQAAAAPSEPEGWKLVPVEPTREMVQACNVKLMPTIALPFFVAAYKTMLDAAPAAPASLVAVEQAEQNGFVAPPTRGTGSQRDALYQAAINCGHSITDGVVKLYANPKLPGNALSQLADRLEAELNAGAARQGGDTNTESSVIAPPAASADAVVEAKDEGPIECWSKDESDFHYRELAELLNENDDLKPGDIVWVADAVRPQQSELIDADDIITTMGERAYDIAGEYAEDYPDVTEQAKGELNSALAAWIGKNCAPTFWSVENVRSYVLSADDFPNDPTPLVAKSGVLRTGEGEGNV